MPQRKVAFITSRDNPLLVRLRKLVRHPGDYRKHGQVLLEGEHLCLAWSERGRVQPLQAVLGESAWQDGRFLALAQAAASIVIVADALLAETSSLETPAPIAFVVPAPAAEALRPSMPSVVLDRLQDAGNVGSILRSAAAFGAVQVVALQGTASLWSPKVLRAAMGAHVGLHLVEGIDADGLTSLEVPMIGTSSHAGQRLDTAALPWPCAWVFGNEGAGTDAAIEARCAVVVRIPQPGGQESLNVGAAAAVCLYESVRRRADAGET